MLVYEVAGVECCLRFQQEDLALLIGDGSVRNPSWDDEEFTLVQRHFVVVEFDAKLTLDDEEEFLPVVLFDWRYRLSMDSPDSFGQFEGDKLEGG